MPCVGACRHRSHSIRLNPENPRLPFPYLKEVCIHRPRIQSSDRHFYQSCSVGRDVREAEWATDSRASIRRSICHSATTLVHAGNSWLQESGWSTAGLSADGEVCMEGSPSPRWTNEAADIFGICRGDPPEGEMEGGSFRKIPLMCMTLFLVCLLGFLKISLPS